MQAPYSHSQQPHAVASRPKYREPTEAENIVLANNIMYDKRVVRGNTYAAQILPATAQAEQLEVPGVLAEVPSTQSSHAL